MALAMAKAARILAVRMRSERYLATRLLRDGFEESTVAAAIERLKGLGYLDDRAMARAMSEEAVRSRPAGKSGLKARMTEAGIPRDIAAEALEGFDEKLSVEKIIERKASAYSGLPREKALRRAVGYLKRRGFSSDTVRKAANRLIQDTTAEEVE